MKIIKQQNKNLFLYCKYRDATLYLSESTIFNDNVFSSLYLKSLLKYKIGLNIIYKLIFKESNKEDFDIIVDFNGNEAFLWERNKESIGNSSLSKFFIKNIENKNKMIYYKIIIDK